MALSWITRALGLTLKVPTAGSTGWATGLLADFVDKISAHDHTGSGKGNKITASALDASLAASIISLPTGMIAPYGGASAPTGWLLCNGSAVSRTTYSALFAIVGEAFGAGDGSTTFNLPDLRQRLPLGKAASGTGSTLGGTGGAIDHTHGLTAAKADIGIVSEAMAHRPVAGTFSSTQEIAGSVTVKPGTVAGTGLSGTTDAANPPYQVVNYIIKT